MFCPTSSHLPKWTSTVKQFTRHARCKRTWARREYVATARQDTLVLWLKNQRRRRLSNMQIAFKQRFRLCLGVAQVGVAAANNESKCQNILLIIRWQSERRDDNALWHSGSQVINGKNRKISNFFNHKIQYQYHKVQYQQKILPKQNQAFSCKVMCVSCRKFHKRWINPGKFSKGPFCYFRSI